MPSVPFQKRNLLRRTDDDHHLHHHLLRRTDDDDQALLAADLYRPYRLEQWADGISDGHTPSCHNNAGLDCLPFHLVGAFATIS